MPRINSTYETTQIKEAILDASIKISLNPQDTFSLLYRAILHDAIGDYENAIDDLQCLLINNSECIDALYLKANIVLKQGDYDKLSNIIDRIVLLESIDMDLINTNFLYFITLLINKRKASIIKKVKSTIKVSRIKLAYGLDENTTWN